MKGIIKQKIRESIGENENLTILQIIDKYNSLKKGLKFLLLNNDSNYAPYHNLNHLLTVTKHCYYGLKFMDMLDDDKTEDLLLAALFHDFYHSMGEKKDDKNIIEAKKGLKEFVGEQKLGSDLEFIDSILDATQYPYVIDESDLDIYQKIIRDADMCQIFEYDWLKQNILGLTKELKTNVVDFLPNQRKFLESLKFLTDYGNNLKDKNFKGVMSDYKILENLM